MNSDYMKAYLQNIFYNQSVIYDMKDEFKSILCITNQDTNIDKWEKYKAYKPPHKNDSIDCDACGLSTYIYNKAFSFLNSVSRPTNQYNKKPYFVYNHKYQLILNVSNGEKEYYRGDVMTSFNHIYKHYLMNFIGNKEIEKYIQESAGLYHTIGNMLPVPAFFNTNRASNPNNKIPNSEHDFWDLTMIKIKDYCKRIKENYNDVNKPLEELLNNNDCAIEYCKKWLKHFDNNWEKFVKDNYLEPFVEKDDNNEYQIKSFWVGHSFNNLELPKDEKAFKEFLCFFNEAIIKRNKLILNKLNKGVTYGNTN